MPLQRPEAGREGAALAHCSDAKSAPAPLTTWRLANEPSGVWGPQGPMSTGNPAEPRPWPAKGLARGRGRLEQRCRGWKPADADGAQATAEWVMPAAFLPTEQSAQGARRPPRGDEKEETEMTGPGQKAGFEQAPCVPWGLASGTPPLPLCPLGQRPSGRPPSFRTLAAPVSPRWPSHLAGFAVRHQRKMSGDRHATRLLTAQNPVPRARGFEE